jgi:hypothetical protein
MEYTTKDLEETAQVKYPDSMEVQQAYIKGFTDACFEQDMSELIDFQHTQELEFYRELKNYLGEGNSINYPEFFESLAGESGHKYIGKLHGTKYIDDKGDMYVEIKMPENPIPLKAKWNFSGNYGVYQWTGAICDSYSGYIVLPTLLDNVFFVYYYEC